MQTQFHRNTLSHNPHRALVRSHESEAVASGNAQKPRFRGGAPRPARRRESTDFWDTTLRIGVDRERRRGIAAAGGMITRLAAPGQSPPHRDRYCACPEECVKSLTLGCCWWTGAHGYSARC